MNKLRRTTFADQYERWRHTFGPDTTHCLDGTVRHANFVVRAVLHEADLLKDAEYTTIPPSIELEPIEL